MLIWIFSKIGIWKEDKNFQKVLVCTSPTYTLKESILNLYIYICCVWFAWWRKQCCYVEQVWWYLMWWYNHAHGYKVRKYMCYILDVCDSSHSLLPHMPSGWDPGRVGVSGRHDIIELTSCGTRMASEACWGMKSGDSVRIVKQNFVVLIMQGTI